LPAIIPSADLLQGIQGVERGLRQRRRLGTLGWAGALFTAALQVGVLVNNSEWWAALRDFDWQTIGQDWPLLVTLFVPILLILLFVWTKFWLRESREPFRYTYSVASFEPAPKSGPSDEKMPWLRQDLMELFSKRIKRLSLLDDGPSGTSEGDVTAEGTTAVEGDGHESHIHIGGYYVIRERPNKHGFWRIEVTPWVRIGVATNPSTLAHPVRFNLRPRAKNGQPLPQTATDHPPTLTADDYKKVLERLFFSVATQIYDRIRLDVQRKIDLLPNDRFRAVAYFHEAEDYARSNTLDSYEAARQLYATAIGLYDPSWTPLAAARWQRAFQHARRLGTRFAHAFRRHGARVWPRLGRVPILVSRAEIGYANMLLYRRALAAMSGQRLNSVFEARPVATRAMERLRRVPDNVPRQRETLFEAYVTLGLTWSFLRSRRRASAWLREARDLSPSRAETDARFLFASGVAEPRVLSKLPLFRRAVELDPEFEVAQFQLALSSEKLWRTRPTLEENVARAFVFDYYDRVTALNPGNISAWSNLGYTAWLIGDARAQDSFESGLEYKDIRRDTYVADLELGLARIAAENGDVEEAFTRFRSATIEDIAQGNAYKGLRGYTGYYFESIGWPILQRFNRYRIKVEKKLRQPAASKVAKRIRDCVHAYALGDYAEASWNYYLLTGDPKFLRTARTGYEKAIDLDPENAAHYLRLYFVLQEVERQEVERQRGDVNEVQKLADRGYDCLNEIVHLEPKWLDGNLAIALEDADRGYVNPNATIFETLLPHDWLWTYDRSNRQTLDWKALRRKRYDSELRWEREFDDVHVTILYTLAKVLDRGGTTQPAAGSHHLLPLGGRRRQRPTSNPASTRSNEAATLFAHLQKHYYPDDFELLLQMRSDGSQERLRRTLRRWLSDDSVTYWALVAHARTRAGRETDPGVQRQTIEELVREVWTLPNVSKFMFQSLPYSRKAIRYLRRRSDVLRSVVPSVSKQEAIRRAVRDWLANPPQPYWALRFLFKVDADAKPLFDDGERVRFLEASIAHPNRSPFFLKWIGDRLRDLKEEERARAAYRAALRSTPESTLRREIEASLRTPPAPAPAVERDRVVDLTSHEDAQAPSGQLPGPQA
jgi:tetratricopeptide (TPR) repeat protein